MHYTLCDLFADLTQNAVEASSSKITVDFAESEKNLTVYIRDNGKGMSADTMKRVLDPFYTDGIKHPKRKVGLGIPFLIQTAVSTGGEWSIDSVPGTGTTVFCRFDLGNIDTPPIGDVPGFFRQILLYSGGYEMIINRKKEDSSVCLNYQVVRSLMIDALGSLEDAEAMSLLGTYLCGLEESDDV